MLLIGEAVCVVGGGRYLGTLYFLLNVAANQRVLQNISLTGNK